MPNTCYAFGFFVYYNFHVSILGYASAPLLSQKQF